MTTPNSSGFRRERVSKSLQRQLLGVFLACLMGYSPIAASAQDQGADPSIKPVVLIVDMQKVQRDSAAAKSVREQSTAIRLDIEKTIAAREALIRTEEKELAELREKLSADEFRERVRQFETKVFANRDFAQGESAKLQAALSDASTRLRGKIAPILATLMKERGAQVMLDSSQVVLSIGRLEITDEVIERLDAEVPTLTLSLEPPSKE